MILELGSVAELEPALAELAFFGRDDVVARVYVGYACSEALRRTGVPAPPEPCPLPAVTCSIEPAVPRAARRPGPYAVGDWRLSWSGAEYAAAVDAVRAAIAEGDVYQANLVQHLWADFDGDPSSVAEALAPLRPLEPEPLAGDGWTIVSASPELLDAMLPGGSVTGCPKIAALDLIAALEPVGRGASMGALGRIHPNGDLDLALTIRTFAIAEGRIHLWVGGGIVWDSDPEDEVEESWVKARPLLAAIGAPLAEAVR